MNCPTCGNPLPENAKFCNKCGRSIRKETPETPAFPPAPEEKNPVIPTAFHAAEEKEPASSTAFRAPEANLFSSGRAPQSPASEKPAGERPPRPRFDVRTGKPILYDNEGNRVTEPPRPVQSPRPRFDPRTGRPVLNEVPKPAAPVAPRPHYDVQTGEPIVYDAAGNRVSPAPRTTPRPATPAAPQPPMPEPPRRVKAVRPSGGLKAVCIILCVLAALSGLLASVTGVVRTCFRADTVRALVEEADLSALQMTDASGREVSLADYIEQTCRIDFLQEYGIDRNELNTLLDQPFLKRYVGKLLAGYAVSLADGEEPEPLTRNGLVDFLRSNDQQIKQLTGFSFVEYEYAGRLGEIDEYLEEYSLDGIFQSLGFSQAEPEKMALTADVIHNLTGVDLPGEVAGLVPNPEWKLERINEMWVGGDTYNMSIGQGYTQVTTLQIADLISMIVNEGTIYVPHLLKEVRDVVTGEVVEKRTPRILHKADISSQTFRELKKAMRRVVAEGSIRRLFNNKVVSVAGKTGTGEVGYTDRWTSWFASFGPYQAENPEDQVVVVVMIEASNEWEWWAPKASNAIYQGIFANQSYEEVVKTLDIWYLNNGTDVIRRRSE